MNEETPMIRQYKALKRELPTGSMLAFRLGDFYELFDDDAIRAAPIIGAALTRRGGVAMCGFPVHSIESYAKKLNAAGQTFAIAEAMESRMQRNGLLRREVTRIFYPNNNQQEGTETMNTNTPNQNTATTEPAPVEEPTAQKKAKRSKPLTPAECEKWHQRQKERNERICAAVRVIRKLAPQVWHDDWWLKSLDWLEAKASELREAADAAKGKKAA